jgi:hypothetical protein
MKKLLPAFALIFLLTSAGYKKGTTNPGGGWTLKNNHCSANKFSRHRETFVAWDTTQTPNPKFIIDFYGQIPAASGTYIVIRGQPKAANQIDIGVGLLHDSMLTFYSTTGGNGKETISVRVSNGKLHIAGTAIELANQKNQNDKLPLTFDITEAR